MRLASCLLFRRCWETCGVRCERQRTLVRRTEPFWLKASQAFSPKICFSSQFTHFSLVRFSL